MRKLCQYIKLKLKLKLKLNYSYRCLLSLIIENKAQKEDIPPLSHVCCLK